MRKDSVGSGNEIPINTSAEHFMYFTTDATHLQAHMTCWVCIGNLESYFVVQPINSLSCQSRIDYFIEDE